MANISKGQSIAQNFAITATSNSSLGAGTINAVYNYPPNVTYGTQSLGDYFIGWERKMQELAKIGEEMTKNTGNYPPYNLYKLNDDTYVLEFALAGFKKSDISVKQEKDTLVIKAEAEDDKDIEYIKKGIALRSFTRVFSLEEHIEVKGAEFVDGLLVIRLERILPEEDKPRVIDIA